MKKLHSLASCAAALALACTATPGVAASPEFVSTSDASHWQVSTAQGGADGQLASFSTANFTSAVTIAGRSTDGVDWIANNATGNNSCCVGNWTFFVFRQTVDLTGYDATKAQLNFQWAADDSGEGFALRGNWTPKFSLNGGALVNGSWPTSATYAFGNPTTVASGLVSGLNTIDFYVEGNGISDGFALKSLGVSVVPEPATPALLLAGLALVGGIARRKSASTRAA